jgi:hypothetical protein
MISNGPSVGLLKIERGVGDVLTPENQRREFAEMVESA